MGRKKTEPAGVENPFAENPPEEGYALGNVTLAWSQGTEHTSLTRAVDVLYVNAGGYQIAISKYEGLRVQAGHSDLIRLPLL